ncbi:MAG: AbrB/MazE/SpoVT family DNA-binding domain-containing protein [Actinomycetota bacterium]
MSRTTVRAKGQITLSDDVRRAAHLEEGDLLEAELTADGILLRPQKIVDATQAWFWTPDWQSGEREVEIERERDQVMTFRAGEELLASLRVLSKQSTK